MWHLLLAGFGPPIVGAVIEGLWARANVVWLGGLSFVGEGVLWMAPASSLVLIGLPSFVLGAIVRKRSPALGVRTALFASSTLALFALLSVAGGIHWLAWLLVAAGVSSRLAVGRERLALRVLRPLTLLAIAIASLGTIAQSLRASGDPVEPADSDGPDIVVIFLDTVRAWNLGLYGYERPTTPALDRLAATSVVYERAIAPAPWTLASHASAFTGQPASRLSTGWRSSLDDTYPTLAEALASRGYRTGGFVANVEYCSSETGLARGFQHYEDYRNSPMQVLVSSRFGNFLHQKVSWLASLFLPELWRPHQQPDRKLAADVVDATLDWIRTADRQRPFFAFLNMYDAHAPYWPPDLEAYLERAEAVAGQARYAESDTLLARYDGGIAYMDAEIRRFLLELDRDGRLENTLLVITSDHGEEFFEHGMLGHGDSLYWPALHVPLIIRMPGARAGGTRIEGPTPLTAIPSLVMDVVAPGEPSPFPGPPLPLESGEDQGTSVYSEVRFAENRPEESPISKGDMKSLVTDSLHYIRMGDGSTELYDHRRDPLEQTDLSGRAPALERRLAGELERFLPPITGGGR
ncbi:MAG: sulfatase-like hydrolase/transferase [Gemmatimonadota bacterium]|nr:sulfatase-like hydrolase/transferase [Gemmatimonadota bacterium]